MKLYYSWKQNLGDSLSPWLFEKLLPGMLDDDDSEILVGIGTILNHKIPEAPFKRVFGSGYGYGRLPSLPPDRSKIYCVRGPITAQRLGLDRNVAVADPAILLKRHMPPLPAMSDQVGFMPHFESLDHGAWLEVCSAAGLKLIDPRGTVEDVLAEMARCQLIVTEAMHGAIVADAMRIPWIAVKPLNQKHVDKWTDHFQSMEIDGKLLDIFPTDLREAMTARYESFRGLAASSFGGVFGRMLGDSTPLSDQHASEEGSKTMARRMQQMVVPTMLRLIPQPIKTRIDGALRDRAARQLVAASKFAPSLSRDAVMESRLDTLEERLRLLRADLAAA